MLNPQLERHLELLDDGDDSDDGDRDDDEIRRCDLGEEGDGSSTSSAFVAAVARKEYPWLIGGDGVAFFGVAAAAAAAVVAVALATTTTTLFVAAPAAVVLAVGVVAGRRQRTSSERFNRSFDVDNFQIRTEQLVDAYRSRVSSALGSVGAPPPEFQSTATASGSGQATPGCDEGKKIIRNLQHRLDDLEKCVSDTAIFVRTADEAIDLVKSASSLRFLGPQQRRRGLGGGSGVVERVERSQVSRSRNNVGGSGSGGAIFKVPLATLRRNLATTLLRQRDLLLTLKILLCDLNDKEQNSYDVTMDGLQPQHHVSDLPPVITISWLRSIRNGTCALLSEVAAAFEASLLLSSDSSVNDTKHYFKLLTAATSHARSAKVYLLASFPIKSEQQRQEANNDLENNAATSSSDKHAFPRKELDDLQHLVDSLQVTLFALQEEARQTSNDFEGDDGELGIWWSKTTRVFGSVASTMESLDESMHNYLMPTDEDSDCGSDDEGVDNNNDGRNPGIPSSTKSEEEYNANDGFVVVEPNSDNKANRDEERRTLVYSGKGSVARSKRRCNSKRETGSPVNFGCGTRVMMDHSILIRELQDRLQSIPRLDELDVAGTLSPGDGYCSGGDGDEEKEGSPGAAVITSNRNNSVSTREDASDSNAIPRSTDGLQLLGELKSTMLFLNNDIHSNPCGDGVVASSSPGTVWEGRI